MRHAIAGKASVRAQIGEEFQSVQRDAEESMAADGLAMQLAGCGRRRVCCIQYWRLPGVIGPQRGFYLNCRPAICDN